MVFVFHSDMTYHLSRIIINFDLVSSIILWHAQLVQVWTHCINIGWTQHMNIIMQGLYSIFEDPNMKGNLTWIAW
jgi:hypothetical protein